MFPTIKQDKVVIGDVITDIVVQTYDDYNYVIVTQIRKIGTIIKAWGETNLQGGKSFQTVILLGKRDDPIIEVIARNMCERITTSSGIDSSSGSSNLEKPLLLAISLAPSAEIDAQQFHTIIDKVIELKTW